MKRKIYQYIVPLLLGIFIFASNFLKTELFDFGTNNFAVWFMLSVFCFAFGWYINKSFGWRLGGKIIFYITITISVLSIVTIVFFQLYFSASQLLVENLILFTLRNVTLGMMGFFGLAICEVFILQRELMSKTERLNAIETVIQDAKKDSDLIIQEAQLKASKIISEAEIAAKEILVQKENIERELKEFIQIEKELIKKYEENE